MSYCGDSSLSNDFQQRVTTVFRQAVELAEEGKTAEALLGCDFILRIDSLFEPARRLQEQTQSDEPVNAADLRALAGLDNACEPETEKFELRYRVRVPPSEPVAPDLGEGELEDSERRSKERITFVTEVEVDGLTVVRSSDLSSGGIYLESLSSFPEGTLLNLRFKLEPTDEQRIQVRGRVLYFHETIGFGLAFENLAAEDKKRIKEYIEARVGT